jgi:hypothetical protein
MKLTKSFSLGAIVFGVSIWIGACAKETPTAPSFVSDDVSGARTADVTSEPTVTLLSDLTASPSEVAVQAGGTLLVTNQSGRAVLLRSFNCSEFYNIWLQSGSSRHTLPFNPAGKACDYFAYDYPQKIFVGRVYVQ